METGKTTKYLKYAIGEIILVVIGILIALQVNNSNENRKLQNQSEQISAQLNQEFTDNRAVLKNRILLIEDANKNVRIILGLINKTSENFKRLNLDSIMVRSFKYGNYNPSNSTIQELIGSGRLGLISNAKLKTRLYDWLQMLEDTDEDFQNQDMHAQTYIAPYLYDNVSIKNFNRYNNIGVINKSELFTTGYSKIFSDLKFENLYHDRLFWNSIMLEHYKELDTLAMEIIQLTE